MSSFRDLFEVNFFPILRTLTPLASAYNKLNADGFFFARIQQEIAQWRPFKISRRIDVSIDWPWCPRCTSKRGLRTMAFVSRNDFDSVPKVASKTLAIDSKKNDSLPFQGPRTTSFCLEKAPKAPALTQSVITFQQSMHLLRGFDDELCHENIFLVVCKAIPPVLAEKSGNRQRVNSLNFRGI